MRSLSSRSRAAVAVLSCLVCAILLQCLLPPAAQAQDISGRRLDDIYINARFYDGYWEWYHQYLLDREEARSRITEIRLQLAVMAAKRKSLRAQWLKLLYEENQLTPKVYYDGGWSLLWGTLADVTGASEAPLVNEAMGISSFGALSEEVGATVNDVAHRWSLGVWGAPLAPRDENEPNYEAAGPESEAAAAAEAALQSQRDQLRGEINRWKERQEELISEAVDLNRELSSSCLEQKEKSGERRQWLNDETLRLDDEVIILELLLYDAARWYLPHELPALVEALDLDNTATEEVAALLRAKVALHQADWNDEKNWLQMTSPRQAPPDPDWVLAARKPRLEAIVSLRRVLEINPDNAEARGMLVEAELYWLREIAAKVNLESRASVEAFRQYLTARGFYADQPQDWYQSTWEVICVLWGLGPIGLTAGLPGLNVADARAIELDATQTAAARNQVSLLAIMRLVKNGVPLTEIPTMTPEEVGKRMTMHTADGRPLPAGKASRVVQDIRDTLRDLPDLRLLASADPEYLVEDVNRAFGRVYYAPLDPTYTWYESVGDLLNIHCVTLLWGPGAIVKIDGKWATSGLMSSSEILAAEGAGTLLTGRQLFLQATRLDRLAQTIAETRIGARFLQALEADRRLVARQASPIRFLNSATRLASALVLYTGVTYIGIENGIPGAALLVEIVAALGPVETFTGILNRVQAPIDELATKLDDLQGVLVRESDNLAQSRRLLDEVSGYADELGEGAIDAQRRATIQTRLSEIVDSELAPPTGGATRPTGGATRPAGGDTPPAGAATRPTSSPSESVDEATDAAARALRNENGVEARHAIARGREAAARASAQLEQATDDVQNVISRLAAARQDPSMQIARPEKLKTLSELLDERAPKFWRPDLYTNTGPGKCLRLADEAQRAGDLEGAYGHLQAARREALATQRTAANAQELDALTRHIDRRIDDVVNAHEEMLRMRRYQSNTSASNASDPIGEQQAQQALEHLDELERAGARPVGSANEVLEVQDAAGNTYFAKRIVPDPGNPLTKDLTPAQIEEILSAEAACYSLAQRVDDIERSLAPTAGGRVPGDLGGLNAPSAVYDAQRGILLTRAIPQQTDLGRQLLDLPEYVFIAYRKEYARQRVLRAWLGDPDGHARNLVRGDDGRLYQIDFDQASLNGKKSRLMPDADESPGPLMSEMMTRFTHVRTTDTDHALYRLMSRMDQEIAYADMESTVVAIRNLVDSPGELRALLTQAGYRDVDAAVRTLTARARQLEPTLKPLFDGELLRMGAASILPFRAGWLASLPNRPPLRPVAAIGTDPTPVGIPEPLRRAA